MILQDNITNVFLARFAELAALFVVLLGVMWLIFGIYEGKRRGSFKERKVKDWDYKITKFLKILTYLGFALGIMCVIAGVAGIMTNTPPCLAYTGTGVNLFTSILLIVIGIFTFLKPANDLPIASIIAILAASAITIILAMSIPYSSKIAQAIDIFVNIKIVFAILFFIVFTLVAIIVKFYSAGIMAVSKAISWPPLALIISIFCFLQGFALLVLGVSILF